MSPIGFYSRQPTIGCARRRLIEILADRGSIPRTSTRVLLSDEAELLFWFFIPIGLCLYYEPTIPLWL